MPDMSARWDKVVILKHMFTLKELEVRRVFQTPPMYPDTITQDDPAAILDIKEDIREECSKLGDVTNVVLFDREEEGVASVRFTTPEAARACVRVCLPPRQPLNPLNIFRRDASLYVPPS